jgi:hypothetical protein
MNFADTTMIAVPTRGQVQWQTIVRLDTIRELYSLDRVEYVQGGLSVAQTRNKIVNRFMESGKQYLIMVDDDIMPPGNLPSLVIGDDKPVEMGVVALPYIMWAPQIGPYLSVYDDVEGGIRPRELDDGLNMVDVAGTGCMAFSRHVFEKLRPNPFRFSRLPMEENFSEDILFCRDVRAAGMDVMAWWDGTYCDHAKLVGLDSMFDKAA